MTSMQQALKALEVRKTETAISGPVEPRFATELFEPSEWSGLPAVESFEKAEPVAPVYQPPEVCSLTLSGAVPRGYADLAGRIEEQLAGGVSNVMLLAAADAVTAATVSMTALVQAVSWQSAGNLLLVDGDLRRARLSRSICRTGAGLVEIMHKTANWSDAIHSTTAPGVDFLPRGKAQIPTVEPCAFAFDEIRARYRAVLVGVCLAEHPETGWLAGRADAVYLVVSQALTTRRSATLAVNALRACGANLCGSLVIAG